MLDFLAPLADYILMGTSIVFSVSLLPTVVSQFKHRACSVPLTSSLVTSVGLVTIAVAEISLGLYFATAAALCSAVMWATVAWQRVYYGRRMADDESLFLTHYPRDWRVGDTLVHYSRTFEITRVDSVAPTRLHTGGLAPCWQVFGRRVSE